MGTTTTPDSTVVRRLVSHIVGAVHPLQIIVFGSAARGEAGPDSDVDLLVVMPEGTHRRYTAEHLYCTIRGESVPFDLVVATPSDLSRHASSPGLIYQNILREGRTVYAA
jgi:predicted nucleotidyltransferase